ncbi:hypothetical protein Zmor_020285 [Zophobas morio]|uniref:Uncharacterized protein n=1 Tax=Zophobas morio TaxID=2755281 RepID=A0AA38M9V7_9CUCU|nr:hypothetical protein Zmor_020285 [Zophobas morio]
MIPLAELPRLVRATLWIPGPPADAVVVLRHLEGQNQWPRFKNSFFSITRPNPRLPLQCLVLGWMRPNQAGRERAGSTICCPLSTRNLWERSVHSGKADPNGRSGDPRG